MNRNPQNFFAEIEQAAFEPSNIVPGMAFSPDKMLLAPGVLLRRRPPSPHRRELRPTDVSAPPGGGAQLRQGRGHALLLRQPGDPGVRAELLRRARGGHVAARRHRVAASGEQVRAAYTLHAEDDDWVQARMLVEQMDDGAKERFVGNVSGHVLNGVVEPVLSRVFQYWRNVDSEIGKRIEQAVTGQQNTAARSTALGATTKGDEAEKSASALEHSDGRATGESLSRARPSAWDRRANRGL